MIENIDNKKLLSETIGVLRFPLMICVVLIHIGIPNIKELLSVNIFDTYVVETFVHIAVPLFFFISGFLFFYGVDKFGRSEYWDKLKKRTKRLLVPYFLWNIMAVSAKYIFYLLEEDGTGLFDRYFKWFYYILWDPINSQLWFVRDLFFVVLLSPIIYFFIKRLNFFFVLIIAFLWFFWHESVFDLFGVEDYFIPKNIYRGYGYGFVSLFFFSSGAWFALKKKDFTLYFKKVFPMAVVSYVIFTIIKFVCDDVYIAEVFNRLAIGFGLMSVVTIVYMLVKNGKAKRNIFLECGSQFIYYYHVIFLSILRRYNLFDVESNFVYFLVYLSVPIITILLGLWLYKLGSKYMPSVMNFILGLK